MVFAVYNEHSAYSTTAQHTIGRSWKKLATQSAGLPDPSQWIIIQIFTMTAFKCGSQNGTKDEVWALKAKFQGPEDERDHRRNWIHEMP